MRKLDFAFIASSFAFVIVLSLAAAGWFPGDSQADGFAASLAIPQDTAVVFDWVILAALIIAFAAVVWLSGWKGFLVGAVAFILPHILKFVVGLPRPGAGVATALGFGFPSAHASFSAALAIVAIQSLKAKRDGLIGAWIGLAFFLAVLVGLSRILFRVHWLSDVVGGWLLGIAIARFVVIPKQ